jgi:hypothetical protein
VPEGHLAWHAERGSRRDRNLLSDTSHLIRTEHWQFSRASVALTTAVYREIGSRALGSARRRTTRAVLCQNSILIDCLLSVRVKASARLVGRAELGLPHDFATTEAKLRA